MPTSRWDTYASCTPRNPRTPPGRTTSARSADNKRRRATEQRWSRRPGSSETVLRKMVPPTDVCTGDCYLTAAARSS